MNKDEEWDYYYKKLKKWIDKNGPMPHSRDDLVTNYERRKQKLKEDKKELDKWLDFYWSEFHMGHESSWIAKQRSDYKKEKLTKEQIKKLKAIKFIWVDRRKHKKNVNNVKRDPTLKKKVQRLDNFKCVVDNSHKSFKTNEGSEYTEVHHIIPWSERKNYKENIDRIENLVTLCPNCHRALGSGTDEEKRVKIEKIYKYINKERGKWLEDNITIEKLQDIYLNKE